LKKPEKPLPCGHLPEKFLKNKDFTPNYKGHVPGKNKKTSPIKKGICRDAMVPGYSGYVFALRSENLFGKTFHRITKEVKGGEYYRNRPHFDSKMETTAKTSYENPKMVDGSHNYFGL